MSIDEVRALVKHLSLSVLGVDFDIIIEYDQTFTFHQPEFLKRGRVYIQLEYRAPCTKTGIYQNWKSGKHYLSSHMTEDEVVKRVYVALKDAVIHEVMEGFKFDNKIVFNPHVNFRELIKITDKEITRS
jgi:hypothetical protein